MVIDSHEHIMVPTEIQLIKMKEAGINKAVLFCTAPHPEKANTLDELKTEMSALYKILSGVNTKEENMKRIENSIKELVNVLKQYPDKFYGFGSVPIDLSLADTVEWIEKKIILNGLKGVGEFTLGTDEQIEKLEYVFQALEKTRPLPIWIHTFNPVVLSGVRVVMRLTKEHPHIPVIFGHMGGYHWMEVIEFAKSVHNAYIDLSAAFSTLAVRMAVTELPDKCLFGSDAPYGTPMLSKQMIEYICESSAVRENILGRNILRLIGEEN